MIYKKILVLLVILLILPCLALADEESITNPEIVKSMRAKITQTGGIDVTGTVTDVRFNISIPVDDEYQDIESITIGHDYEIIKDKYGNQYIELSFDKLSEDMEYDLEIIVSTRRRTGGTPKNFIDFLHPTDHAESDDETIIAFASNFKGDDFGKLASLTKWIHENINYNRNFYNVDETAVQTLNSKEGVCDEITNLLLASSRALGYRSAAVLGWTVGESKTEPHSWAEIYTDNEVIHNDPTWAEVGFLDAAHIKFAVRPDTVFPLVGVRGMSTGSSEISLKKTQTDVEVLEFEQEAFLDSQSELLDEYLWEDQYAVVRSQIAYDGCLLTEFKTQSCAVEGEEFLISERPSHIVYFCDEIDVFSIFKIPKGLDPSIQYTCPLTVYSYLTGSENIDLILRSGEPKGSVNLQMEKEILSPGESFTATARNSHIFTDYGEYSFEELSSEAPENSFTIYGYNSGALSDEGIVISSDKRFDISVSVPEVVLLGEETQISVFVKNLQTQSADVTVDLDGQKNSMLVTADNTTEFKYNITPETEKIQIVVKSGTFTTGITKTLPIRESNCMFDFICGIMDFFKGLFGG